MFPVTEDYTPFRAKRKSYHLTVKTWIYSSHVRVQITINCHIAEILVKRVFHSIKQTQLPCAIPSMFLKFNFKLIHFTITKIHALTTYLSSSFIGTNGRLSVVLLREETRVPGENPPVQLHNHKPTQVSMPGIKPGLQ